MENSGKILGERFEEFRKMLIGFMVQISKLRSVVKASKKDIEKQQKDSDLSEELKIRINRAHLMIFAEHLKIAISIQERSVAKTKEMLIDVQKEIEEEKKEIDN